MPSIGIDLGTTNSCVAVLDDGQVEILQNNYGNRTTPSCVAFSKGSLLVGDGAKLQQKNNPMNTIYGVKRLIGRDFGDKTVQDDVKSWPFEVIDDNGSPKIRLSPEEGSRMLAPELISAIVLKRMREIALDRLGKDLPRAVITVPAYFNGAQRSATMNAARIADLEVLEIINEPTAAALAYGIQRQMKSKRTVLVYDLGGGTFDVTLLSIHGPKFEVIGTGGDSHLGGDDFIQVMVDHLKAEFEGKKKVSLRSKKRPLMRLRDQSETTMKNLSVATILEDRIHLDALAARKDFSHTFTRSTFEIKNHHFFMKTFEVIDRVLSDANVADDQIDDVLMVGGCSRIPFIQDTLKDRFGDKIRKNINPDEAVAYGAAIYAAHLSGEPIPNVKDIAIKDVTPLSLGNEVLGGKTVVIIKRNTRIPVTRQQQYFTSYDDQAAVSINIYEGESENIEENHLLGGFVLDDIPPMPAGQAKFDVEFSIDRNGILKVSACETVKQTVKGIVIKSNQRSLSDAEISDAKQTIEDLIRKSDEAKRRQRVINQINDSIDGLQGSHISEELKQKCGDVENWLQNNEDANAEELSKMLNELQAFVAETSAE